MMFRTRGVDEYSCIKNLFRLQDGNEKIRLFRLILCDSCKAVLRIARRSIDVMFQSRNTMPGRTKHAKKPCDVGF